MKNTSLAKLVGILLLLAAIVLIALLLIPRPSQPPSPAPLASAPETRPAGEPLFTLSPETTAITAPLRPDGTPDYAAALNARYGKGVTPENNAFVAWIALIGTRDDASRKETDQTILSMAGAKPSDAHWLPFDNYCAEHNHPEKGAMSTGPDAEQLAQLRPWKDGQFPIVAAFLKERGPIFEQAEQAWSRPRYWVAAITADDDSDGGPALMSIAVARDLAASLCARAMQRAGSGDFDGYFSDIDAANHISRLLFTGPSTIDRAVAEAVESEMDHTIAASAAAGIFNASQCERLGAALRSNPQREKWIDTFDCAQRWGVLDETLRIAMKQTAAIRHADWEMSDSTYQSLVTIDADAVDWDTVLKQLNATMDAWVHVMEQPLIEDLHAAAREIKDRYSGVNTRHTLDLAPQNGESRKEYTARIATTLCALLIPDRTRAAELCREAHMQYAMAQTLVALAHHHAITGHWPQSLAELPPAERAAVPIDIYALGGKDPVQYVLAPNGPALYSIGHNHFDDGGIRNFSAGKDDLAVGTPLTAASIP